MNTTEQAQIRTIVQGITAANKRIRARYPWLKHQNALGFSLFVGSITAILFVWWAWAQGSVSTWFAIGACAFFMSILHEIEHDLIHRLYFKDSPFTHNFMLLGVWLMRPLTANPWIRREVHIHHHQHSGTATDLEERSIMNGEPWDLRRLISTPDIILAYLLRQPRLYLETYRLLKAGAYSSEGVRMVRNAKVWGMLPFPIPLHLIWYGYLGLWVAQFFGCTPSDALAWHLATWAEPLIICLIAPNILRQFCLHFITSNIHYFGDVEDGNFLQQTQILNAWWTLPFHLFCFNFGATHAIHHFVVMEPFYIRQLSAADAHKVMRENGVRFNDVGTFARANRYEWDV
jgi:hypothetical protein